MPRRRSQTANGLEPHGRPARLAVDVLAQGELELTRDQAHYLSHVLRLCPLDPVILFDAVGREAMAKILKLDRQAALVEVAAATTRSAPVCKLTVGLAVPKGERADWVVEKLTEVGVTHIVWLACERSVALPAQAGTRDDRWQRIARAAAGQSERVGWPEVTGPISVSQFLTLDAERRLIADKSGEPVGSWRQHVLPRSVLLGVGPEGGFAKVELEALTAARFERLCLGPNVLRIETAAVVGAAMILSVFEEN